MKSGNLNFLEPSGPLQACNRTALPLVLVIVYKIHILFIIYLFFSLSFVQLFSLQGVNYIMCFTINRNIVIQNLNYRCCRYCKFTTSALKSHSFSGIGSHCGVNAFINADSFMIFGLLTAISLLNICRRFEGVWCLDLQDHTGHTDCLTLNVEALCFLKTPVTVYWSH